MLKCKTGELYTGSTNDIERRQGAQPRQGGQVHDVAPPGGPRLQGGAERQVSSSPKRERDQGDGQEGEAPPGPSDRLCDQRVDWAIGPGRSPRSEGLVGLLDAPSRRLQPRDQLVGRVHSDVDRELARKLQDLFAVLAAPQVEAPEPPLARPGRVEAVGVEDEELLALLVDVLGGVPRDVVSVPQAGDQ